MKTFKILGLFLTYPQEALISAIDELVAVLRDEDVLPARMLKKMEAFADYQKTTDLMDLQERYVDTFDRGRGHCLHLFEHIHGESRDRGQAMVDLSGMYETKGLYIDSRELPDYLPLFLEYLSLCQIQEATELLGETVDVISMIGVKLRKRKSPYADVFEALEVLSAIKPDKIKIEEALKNEPKEPETLEEIDEEWMEAEAFSGDPLADCKTCNAFPNATASLQKIVGGAQ